MSDAVMVPREPNPVLLSVIASMVRRLAIPTNIDPDEVYFDNGHVRQIYEAVIAASTPVEGWEDISTAPKDGTVFLGCNLDHPSFGSWPMYRRVRHYCDDDGQMQTEDRGGWGKISNLEPDYEDGHTTGPDLLPAIALDALNKSVRYGWKPLPKVEIDAAPPPPLVSTDNGSRPQEAVPAEQADKTVLALRILYDCAQDVRKVLNEEPAVQGPKYRSVGITFTTALDVAREVLGVNQTILPQTEKGS